MPTVLDRPPVLDQPSADSVDDPPPALPRLRRAWGRFLFPWRKTAVGAPTNDDELHIDNRTADAWVLCLKYRDLGIVEPFGQRVVRVVKAGQLTARPVDGAAAVGYLIAQIRPNVRTVEIHGALVLGELMYDLRLVE